MYTYIMHAHTYVNIMHEYVLAYQCKARLKVQLCVYIQKTVY